MRKKEWYNIEIECIKFNPSIEMRVGEKKIVARVKSYGLAYATAQTISGIYKDNCAVAYANP